MSDTCNIVVKMAFFMAFYEERNTDGYRCEF